MSSASRVRLSRTTRLLGAGVALLALCGPTAGCSPDDDEVCREFSADLVEVARDLTAEAGSASADKLPPGRVDDLRSELGRETYAIEVHRDQLGCDRDRLEGQLCPELAKITTRGEVAADLLATMEAAYDCED